MDQIGKYRNETTSLSALNIRDYERIFKVYNVSTDGKEFPYYNILKKIDLGGISDEFVDYYDVLTKMPMTTISYEIYGDLKSWWIIYLMNKDEFDTAPFWVEGGVKLRYLIPELRSQLYGDITQNTIYSGRHF